MKAGTEQLTNSQTSGGAVLRTPWEFRLPYLLAGNLFTLLTAALYLTRNEKMQGAIVYVAAALFVDYRCRASLRDYLKATASVRIYGVAVGGSAEFNELLNKCLFWFGLTSAALASVLIKFPIIRTTESFEAILLPGYSTQNLEAVQKVLPTFQLFRSVSWLAVTAISLFAARQGCRVLAKAPALSATWQTRPLWAAEMQNVLVLIVEAFFILWGYALEEGGVGVAARAFAAPAYLFYLVMMGSVAFIFSYLNLLKLICQHWIDLNSRIPVQASR